jgi:hypothetical protein
MFGCLGIIGVKVQREKRFTAECAEAAERKWF